MGVLVACCVLIGLVPLLVRRSWSKVSRRGPRATDRPVRGLTDLAPLDRITAMGLLLVAPSDRWAPALVGLARRNAVAGAATWGCGYPAPGPSMQYTASSFAQMLVGMFGWVLRPRVRRPADLAVFPARRIP